MRAKIKTHHMQGLPETAGSFLTAALRSVEEQLDDKMEELGEVSALFTWEGKEYRAALSRYSED